jgi:glycosyltransferase involved in cell wall biosynthesis
MRITYVGYGDFHYFAGMKQLYHFAQEVCRQGHQAQILIAGSAETARVMHEPPSADIVEMRFSGPLLSKAVRGRVKAFQPDIIHVWTPRFLPALAGWQLHQLTNALVILDHEDDEDYHLHYMRRSWTQNWQTSWRRLAKPAIKARNAIRPWFQPLTESGNPTRPAREAFTYQRLTKATSAHTAISPNLVAWAKGQWPERPVHLLYPGANLKLFSPTPPDALLLADLGLVGRSVLVYSGTMSIIMFRWFLDVLENVIREIPDVALLLIGEDSFRAEAKQLAVERGLESSCHLIGQQPYTEVPRFLSLANVLLQHPLDLGNEMRLPAKLPEYLATGKPIITFAAGIGQTLEDGIHVRKLFSPDPLEAATLVKELLQDPVLSQALGESARQIASDRFDWTKNGRALVGIYEQVLQNARQV